jgi:hypothetical protein
MKVTFLGRDLGKASGWDGDLGECWWVYDFTPNAECTLPACKCLQFDEAKGEIHAQDNEGNSIEAWQIEWRIGDKVETSLNPKPITKT